MALTSQSTRRMEAGTYPTCEENNIEDKEPSRAGHSRNIALSILNRYKKYWCTKKAARRCLPVLTWLPGYSRLDLRGDLIAGTTVALTVIPQSLAYAQLATLPPQYGLYTAFMGCFLYSIFGSSKDLTIGPTAVLSLMTSEHVQIGGIPYAVLLSFLCGCVQLAMGLLNLGFFVSFISAPVLSGFISAAAIIIATSQLKGLFGLKFKSSGFLDTVYKFFTNIHQTNYWDLLMGCICIVFLLLLRHFKDSKLSKDSKLPSSTKRLLENTWWTVATGRNALMVLICAGIACILLSNDINAINLTKEVKAGLPSIAMPSFSCSIFDNTTNRTVYKSFSDIATELGSGIIVISFVSVVEAIAIAKAFSKGKEMNATQEIIALGICNLVGSFVSSYPITASFSRTVINNTSGVRTPLAAVFTGCFVLLALGVLAPYFQYIPKSCLCAIVFSAVIFMVHYRDVIFIWRSNKIDVIPLTATFMCSFVFGLEYGILIGTVLALVIYLYQQSRPNLNIRIETLTVGIICMYVKPDKNLLYPTIEYAVSKITKHLLSIADTSPIEIIVLDGEYLTEADYTTAMGVKYFIESFKKQNIIVIFTNLKKNILNILQGLKSPYFHYCMTEEDFELCISENICNPTEQMKSKSSQRMIHPNGTATLVDTPDSTIQNRLHQRNSAKPIELNQMNELDLANESLLSQDDSNLRMTDASLRL